ncbi:hypothetical protein COCC4DRAFT_134252 [Bipolaris maydis ATCC 48331]|uniref:BTB domain-containing protein n=2 Tax=Cochliobolus heterostrophus TaxID=5016 RepID=M2U0F3_COCH5|nr:uncharacterized protein COCC4DRAFT_134252 [Bipolaris maydis ATCC 48331]EMD87551.1 hypothetical protein COCHEDRAFT_1217718 [Bipolaris maydis C5]ENI06752.1 hypothetical protein COCC4DRAFT_134252 [Bipolaris maydis ATCC 48331]KAJ5056077.1 hypothetical protein J3E74DRAFT_294440 [Bipolaris maydis]KAJ6193826.1 hypothetical protein J3E72DRAFT_378495 [Bipolaris maydis]
MNAPQKRKNDDTCPSRKRVDRTVLDNPAEFTVPEIPAESTVLDTPAEFTISDSPTESTDKSTGGRPEVTSARGDVILEPIETSGQGTRRLLVSSVVLSHASPLFSIMFCRNSYAGHPLPTSSPPTVPLSGDDPKSIFSAMPDHPFQNIPAARQAENHRVRQFRIRLPQNPEDAEFEKLILATYFLDLPQSFNKVTRSII